MEADHNLNAMEKRFLLLVERGDVASVKRLLDENKDHPELLNINCVDPLNRSALIAAIENENIDLIRLLLDYNIKVKDSLLHAIKEEYVEAVEILLEWEERIHVSGQPYSWEAVDRSTSNFTPDITPLVLAAHMNNYEILKILLDRGASLPMPHDVRCGCDECVVSSEQDSLRHSQSRINAYRALTSPSLIALSSRDPLLTAFELSWELRRLSKMETEFRAEYNEMRAQTQEFATSLLDHARTSNELEIMLNYDPESIEPWEIGERQTLDRLKLAIKYKQKKFVAHPNVQQLLAAIWYEGLPGFRRKSMMGQMMQVGQLGAMFPVYSTIYMMAPKSKMALFMKKPFVKFICHSASYACFLSLLGGASQRIEYLLIEWFGPDWLQEILEEWKRKERGGMPGLVESGVILWVLSLIWNEARSLWADGLLEYVNDLWNIVDFIQNFFYVMWIVLRFTSVFIVYREYSMGMNPWYPREHWDQFDPMLLSEGAFAAGMIFSFLKLVHIFSVNPHLGPLQISLGRMIIDIIKFFFIYTLVLFAFGCGLNQLLWYYSDLEKAKCYHHHTGVPDFDQQERACTIWRRFTNLFETSQSLFWASFGLVDLMTFDLTGIKGFTRFWALLMFGSYSVINIIVLLNMLIAMMSNSYQIISERSDTEWKFARSGLWISYFDDGNTLPPPFNLFPTMKNVNNWLSCGTANKKSSGSVVKKSREKAKDRHDTVMRLLVRRYVTAEQRKRDDFGITEDDVMEIRQDISTLRYELIDILRSNGMKTPNVNQGDNSLAGKKGRVMERRLMKDFQIGLVEGIINEVIQSEKGPKDVFSKIAQAIGRKAGSSKNKKDWNEIVRKNTGKRDPIGSTAEFHQRLSRQSLRRHIIENKADMDPERLVEYNPMLSTVSPATRVAYAKFKMPKIKQEFDQKETSGASETNSQAGDDDVFQGPASVKKVSETKQDSIVRPRPRPSIPSITSVASQKSVPSVEPAKATQKDTPPQLQAAPSTQASVRREFRPRTPIPEDPREDMASPEPLTPKSSTSSKPTTPRPPSRTSTGSKSEGKEEVKKDEKTEVKKDEKKEVKKDEAPKPSTSTEPRRPAGPPKSGGKSKVTGEVLHGWL
ncbi:transient receptor potential protein-like [Macrosteles quadrilineatus]|uniref:transient receptor potential protein-like n=1 Tax=Macrosteles quadrilineatus TaxID=74068 RepID=UPI0023E1EE04|nr:transient receptor potential protein-like [Macrosteles quadrilineatus]